MRIRLFGCLRDEAITNSILYNDRKDEEKNHHHQLFTLQL